MSDKSNIKKNKKSKSNTSNIEVTEVEIIDDKQKQTTRIASFFKEFFNALIYWINPTNWFKNNSSTKVIVNKSKTLEEASIKDLNVSSNGFIRFLKEFRIPLISICVLGIMCGILYPTIVTITAQATMPYQANGSKIEITLDDGTKKVFGSELIGQTFYSEKNKQINGTYLFGRPNFSASINSDEFNNSVDYQQKNINEIIKEVNNKKPNTYIDPIVIPQELLSPSASGLDPHISISAAKWQIKMIVEKRNELILSNAINPNTNKQYGSLVENSSLLSEQTVEKIIDKFTTSKFVLYGEDVVNILKVNLELDGYKVL